MKEAVPLHDRSYVRSYITDCYENKWVVQRSVNRASLSASMRAVGPLINWREGKGLNFVSFYRNKLKIKDSLCVSPKQLELIHEQSAHRILFEIIFLLFCDYF